MRVGLVIMGVAGCGKSSLAATVAGATGLRLVEGDDFHSAASRAKMSQGVALTDLDRSDWLDTLAAQLQAHPEGVVLTCSALRRAYRDRLRAADPALRFVFLELDRPAALVRVQARAGSHFFHAGLVDSQFETLESPVGEAHVLRLDATAPPDTLLAKVLPWLDNKEAA